MMFDHRHSTPLNSTPYRPWSSVPVLLQKRSVRARAGPSLLTIARARRFSGSQSARTILPPADRKHEAYCRTGLALAPLCTKPPANVKVHALSCDGIGRLRIFTLSTLSVKMGLPLERYGTIPHIVYLCSVNTFHFYVCAPPLGCCLCTYTNSITPCFAHLIVTWSYYNI
jgi:hypothetical protein